MKKLAVVPGTPVAHARAALPGSRPDSDGGRVWSLAASHARIHDCAIPDLGGRGGIRSLVRSPWRLTLALAALIAVAALAVFSLNTPVNADAYQPEVLFGSCTEVTEPVCVDEEEPGDDIEVMGLKAIQISSGTSFVLTLGHDGTISCWGETDAVEAILCGVPDIKVQRGNNVRLTAGEKAVVVLNAHGRPAIDETGQEPTQGNRYLVDQEEVRWSQVAAGNVHSCGITTEGEVYC